MSKREREKYANSKWNLRNMFCCCSDLKSGSNNVMKA